MIRYLALLLLVCSAAFSQTTNCTKPSTNAISCTAGSVRYGESNRTVAAGTIAKNTFSSSTTGYIYLLPTGGLYLGHNGTTGQLTLSGFTEVGGLVTWPANATPLYTVAFTSGNFGQLVLAKAALGNVDLYDFSGKTGAGATINAAKTVLTIPPGTYVSGSVSTAIASTATITLGASSAASGSQFWFSFDPISGNLVVTTSVQMTPANVTVSNITKGEASATGYAAGTFPIGYCTAGNVTVDKIDSCVDARTSVRGQPISGGSNVTVVRNPTTGAVEISTALTGDSKSVVLAASSVTGNTTQSTTSNNNMLTVNIPAGVLAVGDQVACQATFWHNNPNGTVIPRVSLKIGNGTNSQQYTMPGTTTTYKLDVEFEGGVVSVGASGSMDVLATMMKNFTTSGTQVNTPSASQPAQITSLNTTAVIPVQIQGWFTATPGATQTISLRGYKCVQYKAVL